MDAPVVEQLFEQVLAAESGRMMVIVQTPFMFAAVNDNGRAALFIRVSLAPAQVVSDGQGFSVKTTRSGNNDYVQITASDRGLPPLFLKLVEYVLGRVAASTSVDEGTEQLIRSIEEYRRFVGRRRAGWLHRGDSIPGLRARNRRSRRGGRTGSCGQVGCSIGSSYS